MELKLNQPPVRAVDIDDASFDALFRQYYGPLCAYAARMTDGDWGDAEDIVQQAFIKLWEQKNTLAIQWSVKAYLYKTVHNRCLNRIRDKKLRQRHHDHLKTGEEGPETAFDELGAHLQKALEALPGQCREIFELSRFHDMKYREIADHLEISIKTVESQMGKALKILREQLQEYLVTLVGCLIMFFC